MTDNGPIECGDKAKDLVTGLEGIVLAIADWQHGCSRIHLGPQSLQDGKPADVVSFDEARIELIERGVVPAKPLDQDVTKFPMGAKVKDKLTGFSGVIGALERPLTGNVAIMIEPDKLSSSKTVQDSHWFDANRVEVIQPKKPAKTKNKVSGRDGGPAPLGEMARGRKG